MPLCSVLALGAGRRSKWLVLLLWIGVAGVAGPISSKLPSVEQNDPPAFLPGSAESVRELRLEKQFPSGVVTPAIVVYRRASGLTATDRARVLADRGAIASASLKGVGAPGPLISSRDGRQVFFSVPITARNSSSLLLDCVEAIRYRVNRGGNPGLQVAVTGPAGFSADGINVFANVDTSLLLVTAGIVVLLLFLTYRSPLLWILPLIALGLAEIGAQAAASLAAQSGLTVNGMDASIQTILVFGAGTDYALLLIARYREELRRHEDRCHAMRRALSRAGPAILASGATVTLALLGLLVADLTSIRGLGPVGAAGIVFALVAMLTALPALLLLAGRRAFWPFIPQYESDFPEGSAAFARLGCWIAARPRSIWVGTSLALAIFALGLIGTTIGGSTSADFRVAVDSVTGQRLLAASYPTGASEATQVIVRPAGQVQLARQAAASTPGVARVGPIERSGGLARFDVTLAADPAGNRALSIISALRDRIHTVAPGALVGGPTAQQLDTQKAALRDSVVIVPLVLVTVLLVLGLLLRAVLAPLLLVATVVLSCSAAFGVSVVVFQNIFHYAGIDPQLPLLAFLFLVALGVDYNIFLMARAREEANRHGTKSDMLRSLAVTGGVITSAGVVLAGTFSSLAVLPLVSLTEIAFAVAFGVLLDTLVVRSVLMPALTLDVGARLWWPSRLGRVERTATSSLAPRHESSEVPV